jgi:hypothetical protein
VEFLLEGAGSNRGAVGAQVRIVAGGNKRMSFVNGGNSFAGQSTARVHFGLADAAVVETAEIRWPSGRVETLHGLPADRLWKIREGQTEKK